MKYLKKEIYQFSKSSIKTFCELLKTANIRQKQLVQYINIPAAFDIETSTCYDENGNMNSFMYIWQFGINIEDTNYIIYGRSWLDFKTLLAHIVDTQKLGKGKRFIIYIHNLSYEFSFIARRFDWEKVFSIDRRKPLFCRTYDGIEFRCSYQLTGLSLENLAKSLNRYKCSKKVGWLDYSKIRGAATPITRKELEYDIDDIHVLLCAIKERIEDSKGTITKLPLTKTGYVRDYVRQQCFGVNHKKIKYRLYRAYMESLTLDLDFYCQCKRAFAGGYTHANAWYVDRKMYNVGSMDICSSYPASMCLPVYPISSFTRYEKEINDKNDLYELFNNYCCIFDIEFQKLRPKIEYENYISESKCWYKSNVLENNGRVVSADDIIITITEIDFEIIDRCYSWDKIIIKNVMIAERGYLPKSFIFAILNLYKNKTELKGIAEKQAFYQNQKEMLNSSYGMTVQDVIQELITFDDLEGWGIEEQDENKLIEKYNHNRQRFTYYPWGIYVTAESRKHLWQGIYHLQNDYIYTDTDSLKYRHPEKHTQWFENYNKWIISEMKKMCDYYNFDYSYIEPQDIKGNKHYLGIYESEGIYKIFLTLGAKRYLYMDSNGHNVSTVAGVKKKAINYLNKKYGRYGIFEHFNNSLVIPAAESGKTESVYLDDPIENTTVDYLGNEISYKELTSVSIRATEYSMNRSKKFIEYLSGIKHSKKGDLIING